MTPLARRRLGALAVIVVLLASACSTPILANPPLTFPSPAPASQPPSRAPDPIPVTFPLDDGPHDRLTEWWYYTGHLRTQSGRRYGFEAVVFRAERGTVPPTWAAHLALTDEAGDAFHYAQRSEIGPQADHSPRAADGEPTGFDLQVTGLSPALVAAGAPTAAAPWRLAGANGSDHIEAALAPEEAAATGASFGLNLDLETTKPEALHDGGGFVDFGPGGSSYYYSRTRLAATGTLQLDGEQLSVDGIAWFDHQWGDFVSVGGGWDWFAVNLSNGQDLTVSVVYDAAGRPALRYGTLVDADGTARNLRAEDVEVETFSSWVSSATGRSYPNTWRLTVKDGWRGEDLIVRLEPTVLDQELDTRATTGVVYWEGSQHVSWSCGIRPIECGDGDAYVELTRYGP